MHSAVAEDGLQDSCSFVVRDHHTVILTNSSTGGRTLTCTGDKAVCQDLVAIVKLGRGWPRVVMSKALLISVTGDRYDVSVWDSSIGPQSYGCRPDAMVSVELR